MNETEQSRIGELCALIITEKDPDKFSALIKEVNDLLAAKGRRLVGPPEITGSD
jgi:hypothetical protein